MLKSFFSLINKLSINSFINNCSLLSFFGLKSPIKVAPNLKSNSNSNTSLHNETNILKDYLEHLENRVLILEKPITLENNNENNDLKKSNSLNTFSKYKVRSSWREHNKDLSVESIEDLNIIDRFDELKNQMHRIASAALDIYSDAKQSICDIFISYKQNDGSDALVINTHYSLKEKNVDAWLDKMRGDERSESGMVAGVKSCKLFCAVISPYYFKSKFCILELETAVKYSKKIVICFNGSKFKIQEALSWIPDEYSYLKNDELIKLDEDNEYMQIGLLKVYKRL